MQATQCMLKPSEWIEFKFIMAKLSQADKVIIQSCSSKGWDDQDSVPDNVARQTQELFDQNNPDFTEVATAT